MDGLPEDARTFQLTGGQRTLKTAIDCVGIGLHSGAKVRLSLLPAPAGSGISLRRVDIPGSRDIAARWDNVVDTRLCTVLADPWDSAVRVSTVEHVLAALAASGVTNAVVAVNGPEAPILDGSAASFLFLVDCAGVSMQDAPALAIEVLRPVRVQGAGGESAALLPWNAGRADRLDLEMTIDFPGTAIGRQSRHVSLEGDAFRRDLARARTFTLAGDIARLRAAGLARGGSLDNAIVVDGDRILNPGGLRMADEFVRHKLLDAVGDLALAGSAIHGRFVGHCSGHALNNALLRAFFAEAANWRTRPLRERLLAEAPHAAAYVPAAARMRAA